MDRLPVGKPKAFEGTATASEAAVAVNDYEGKSSYAVYFSIQNLGTSDIKILFNDDTVWAHLAAGEGLSFDGIVSNFKIKTVSGSSDWNALTVLTPSH